ncbi:MAG: sigma-70 family RNA polymerase sigma factor [Acidobacteria bacterium]|nr:sigma-70 family RNA polymerase sigma factor [Acidobacteriota bacterium]
MRRREPTFDELAPEDRALAQRVLDGDREAFETFFEEQFPGLYRFALSRLRDPETARDVVQSAICKAIANLRGYRGEASLTAWMFTICRNEIRGHFRKRGRAPSEIELFEDTSEGAGLLDSLSMAAGDPELELRRKELAGLVHTTLDRLPSRYGQALEWKYVEGLSVVEIAERLKVGPKAAESVLTRARVAFREGFSTLGRQLSHWKTAASL